MVTLGALMTASGVLFAVMGFGDDKTVVGLIGVLLVVSGIYLVASNLRKEKFNWRTRRKTGPSDLASPWIPGAPGDKSSGSFMEPDRRTCPSCQQAVDSGESVCRQCGWHLPPITTRCRQESPDREGGGS